MSIEQEPETATSAASAPAPKPRTRRTAAAPPSATDGSAAAAPAPAASARAAADPAVAAPRRIARPRSTAAGPIAQREPTAQREQASPSRPGAMGEPVLQEPPKTAPRHRFGVAAAVAISALVGGAAGAGGTALVLSAAEDDRPAAVQPAPSSITINNPDAVNLVAAVAAKASTSVVTINVEGSNSSGSGSGVVLSADGYVVTNNHVVTLDGQRSAPRLQVTTADGTIYAAEIVGTDPVVDLAVVKLVGASGLRPVEFADSAALNVGDATVAIGAPLGLSGTVTNGIVSAVTRSITVASPVPAGEGDQDVDSSPSPDQLFDFWRDLEQRDSSVQRTRSTVSLPVIQTDAAINPGNSGGALLDGSGALIGINVAIASTGSGSTAGSIGVGFAIPSNLVRRVADELIADGSASHALLGATVGDSTERVLGARIGEVTPGSAAERAGLRADDVVVEFNGVAIRGATDLTAQVRSLPGGAEAGFVYVRGGTRTEVTVTLGTLAA